MRVGGKTIRYYKKTPPQKGHKDYCAHGETLTPRNTAVLVFNWSKYRGIIFTCTSLEKAASNFTENKKMKQANYSMVTGLGRDIE